MSFQALTWALDQKTGAPAAKMVLLALANYANQAGECWPSYDRIAADTEMSKRSVIDQVKKLENLGLISIGKRRNAAQRQETNLYMLALHGATVTISVEPGENSAPGVAPPGKPAPAEQDENIETVRGADPAPGTGCRSEQSRVQNLQERGAGSALKPVKEPIIEPLSPETPLSVSTAARGDRPVEREGFSKLVEKWPVGARDRLAEAETLFSELAGPDRFHAVRYAPEYLAERRGEGRKITPSLAAYLRDAPWRFWSGDDADQPDAYFVAEKSPEWRRLRAGGFCGRAYASDRFQTRGRWFRRDELVGLGVDPSQLTEGAPP